MEASGSIPKLILAVFKSIRTLVAATSMQCGLQSCTLISETESSYIPENKIYLEMCSLECVCIAEVMRGMYARSNSTYIDFSSI